MYKLLHEMVKSSLISVHYCASAYNLRNSDHCIKLPQPRTKYGIYTFQYFAARNWNMLAIEIKKATSLRIFKNMLSDVI